MSQAMQLSNPNTPNSCSEDQENEIPLLLESPPAQNKYQNPVIRAIMNPIIWHKVAAVSGMAALGLGTYGAHVFKPKNPSYKDVWQTASLYHLAHTAALVAAPVTKHPYIFGGLLTAGIVGFSGTCYMVAFLEDRTYAKIAPFGGFAFIAAWGSLLF